MKRLFLLAALAVSALVPRAEAQSPVRLNLQIPAGYPRLSITGAVGSVCTVQCRTNLAQANWLTLTTFALTNTLQWWNDTNGPATGPRWYRALVQPVTSIKYSYGTSVMGQDLAGYKISPITTNGRKALLNFEVHGFEDAWDHDGYALTAIANRVKSYYYTNPAALNGWTVYLNPSANPDGEIYGTNKVRELQATYSFGRCTANGRDINRNFSLGTSVEQRKLATLVTNIAPTIILDFHGWCSTFYGTNTVGKYFANSFNAPTFPGKPSKYGYVDPNGVTDWGTSLGTTFHSNSLTRGSDYFTEFELNKRNIPSALIEYPAPAFKHVGTQLFDKTFDPGTGLYFMDADTLEIMISRTEVALDDLFAHY